MREDGENDDEANVQIGAPEEISDCTCPLRVAS
jgi:hypothetical protein